MEETTPEAAAFKPARMMPGKLYVITDAEGNVVGTASVGLTPEEGTPVPGCPIPMPGQKVHEIDHTPELQKAKTPTDLHQAVARLVK